MTHLNPCPFCGGEAETDFIAGYSYRIECWVLGCCSGPMRETEAEAIAAWNKRAPNPLDELTRLSQEARMDL